MATATSQADSPPKRIIITGGTGIVGREIVKHLQQYNYHILNLDIQPNPDPSIHTLITDVTDQAQVLSALTTPQYSFADFSTQGPLQALPDAIIHFAAYPRVLIAPDHKTFTTNVNSAFNVIDAAGRLGIKKVILASTQSAYGAAYAPSLGEVPWPRFPILEDEENPNPQDVYGLSKLVSEQIGRSYAARYGMDIYALRIGHVMTPGSYKQWMPLILSKVETGRRGGWSYIDGRDLAEICRLGVETDGLGWQVFNVVNDEVVGKVGMSTRDWLESVGEGGKVREDMPEWGHKREAPTSNEKVKRMLGWREKYRWEEEWAKENPDEAGSQEAITTRTATDKPSLWKKK